VMSIHQAKGLEFPVVLMGSVVNGRLPNCERTEAFNIPHDMRASGLPEVENPHIVDERKLFYVAATRARDLLIIGTSDAKTACDSDPSIFLKEMFGEDLEAVADLTKGYVEKVESKPCSRQTRMRHSFSKLSYFLQCPLRYKYAVIYDFRMPWSESGGLGDNVHRALEAIHHKSLLEGRLPTDNEVAKIVKDKWVTVNLIDQDQENSLIDEAVEQINCYLHEHCNLSAILQAETSFSFDLNGQIIQGSIDLLKRDGKDSIEIVDFKTYEMMSDDKEIRSNNIDFQLDIYALGVERALRQKVAKTTVHFLKDGKLLTTEWSSERRDNTLTKLIAILENIANGQYSPNLDYCVYCQDFKELCPYGVAYPR
ncbi:MAG: PD-(D/E)XK nuclease family protein, partial [Methanotrichaceae archaeon]|nr:PD-(D/E)XK nuclease family protein [Methanotrichaceae archaeon]